MDDHKPHTKPSVKVISLSERVLRTVLRRKRIDLEDAVQVPILELIDNLLEEHFMKEQALKEKIGS